jgi:uncharacterized protein (DUF433 family)
MKLPNFLTRHRHGEIRLTGHRIGLFHIVESWVEGLSPEKIAERFPSVPLALVYAVIAFYLMNRAEVDAYVTACREEIEKQAAAPQPGPDLAELARFTHGLRPA